MNNKKTLIGAVGMSVAAVATTLVLSSHDTTELTGTYTINTINPYLSEMTITVPDEFTPDICELKFNELEVTKTILPNGKFMVYPVITNSPDKVSVDMYVRGELAGTAIFSEVSDFDSQSGLMTITVDKKYIKEAVNNENEE